MCLFSACSTTRALCLAAVFHSRFQVAGIPGLHRALLTGCITTVCVAATEFTDGAPPRPCTVLHVGTRCFWLVLLRGHLCLCVCVSQHACACHKEITAGIGLFVGVSHLLSQPPTGRQQVQQCLAWGLQSAVMLFGTAVCLSPVCGGLTDSTPAARGLDALLKMALCVAV